MKHQDRTGPANEDSRGERDQEQGTALALLGAVLGVVGVVLLLVGLAGGSGSAVQARPADKVFICHFDRNQQGPNAGPHVIEINENAVDHHLANHVKKAGFIGDDFVIEDGDLALCTAATATATVETPTATVETPTATVETPTATVETPTATVETPTATVETPTPTEEAAAAVETPTATEEAAVLAETPVPTATEEAAVLAAQELPATGSGGASDSGLSRWVAVGAVMIAAGLGLLMTSWRLSRET